jgi:hypothetical protein
LIRTLGVGLFVAAALLAPAGEGVGATSFAPTLEIGLPEPAVGAHSALGIDLNIQYDDALAEATMLFIPSEFQVGPGEGVVDGAWVGRYDPLYATSLIGSPCNHLLPPEINLVDASVDPGDTIGYEAGFADNDGDGLPDAVTKYPEPLTRIFPGLTPLTRMFGLQYIAGIPHPFNLLVFSPGTSLFGEVTDPELGYPSVLQIRDRGDPASIPFPNAITDECSPSLLSFSVFGITEDNNDTSANEGGYVFATNPLTSGAFAFSAYMLSLPDADDDGIENQLDTCPFAANAGNPRINTSGDADLDGLDLVCDPNDNPATGGTNSDQDSDGYLNRQDNCPLVQNGELDPINQTDTDLDGIGDNCDPAPMSSNGHKHSVCAVDVVNVGSGGSPPPVLLPSPCDADQDDFADASDNCPTVPNASGQTDDADGDLAGDVCDGPGSGNVDCSGPIGGVSSVDALKVLRHTAGLPVAQSEPCLDMGMPRALKPPADWRMGDVNCSGGVNAVDALLILRAVAGLSVVLPEGCPEIKPS